MERRARVDGGIVSEPGDYQYQAGAINVLGSGIYQSTQTKTERNPQAERMAGSWQVLTNRYFEREGYKNEGSNLLSGDEEPDSGDGDNSPDDNNYFG